MKNCGIEATKLRLVALRDGTHPYDASTRRNREADRIAGKERREASRVSQQATPPGSDRLSLRAIEATHRRVRQLRKAADELLDMNATDLRACMSDADKFVETQEALALAASAIAQLQEAVGWMVPA